MIKLIIASACDHYTRIIMGGSKLPSNAPTYGLLFGLYTNSNKISILESTDAIYEVSVDGSPTILSQTQIEKKIKLWTAVYTDYKLLGWYAFNDEVIPEHMLIHNQILEFNNESIFILIHKTLTNDINLIPLDAFSKEFHEGHEIFINISFHIETSQVEKIALDQIMKSVPTEGLSSTEIKNQSMLTSLKIMDNKVEIIIDLLFKMRDGNNVFLMLINNVPINL